MLNVTAPATIKNILVATDFSPLWDVALPFASAVAKHHQANLTLLHVVPGMIFPEMPLEPYPPSEEKLRERTLEKLGQMADTIPIPGPQKSTVFRKGDILQAVLDISAERHVDLVVVTTHGRSGFSRLMLGSTAEQILRQVPCPVLTIGPKVETTLELDHIKTILLPVDFSTESQDAVKYGVGLGMENQAKLVLLNVVDETMQPYEIESDLTVANRKIVKYDTGTLETARIVRVGHLENEIAKVAKEVSATCMVMGRHKHGMMSTHLPFNTLHSVLSNAPCPVFTVA